jgi:hypothetical protein
MLVKKIPRQLFRSKNHPVSGSIKEPERFFLLGCSENAAGAGDELVPGNIR